MKKEKTITNSMQEVAVDILIDIITEEYHGEPLKKEFFDRIMERYDLWEDPFTHLPCTSKEYAKLQKEYNDQLMMEKYGYVE